MNNGHNGISISAILLLGVALLFSSVQQGYGSSELPLELNEEQITELYKLEQLVKAEQTRDEILDLWGLENPYLDTSLNAVVIFEDNDEEKPLNVNRRDENFQLIKDEQISIAGKKFKELLGGKTILNFNNNELNNKKPIHTFTIDNQTGHMKRNSGDFQNYLLLQISKAEIIRDSDWQKFSLESNPYQNNEPSLFDVVYVSSSSSSTLPPPSFPSNQILTFRHNFDNSEIKVKVQTEKVKQLLDGVSTMNISLVNKVTTTDDIDVILPSRAIKRMIAMTMSNNEENQNLGISLMNQNDEKPNLDIPLKRQTKEFKNLMISQISLAENIRNERAEFGTSDYSNPYLNENTDEPLDKTNKNDLPVSWTDLDFVTNELELTRLDRDSEEFEMAKTTELEIAQNTLNEMLLLSNSKDIEITNPSNEKVNNFVHGDVPLKIIKNKQIDLADKKLFELYGY